MRQDLISALRNAIERGYSVEQAKQSLLNSGYKQEEIDEAANYFSVAKPEARQEAMQVEQEPIKRQSLEEQGLPEVPEVPLELLPEPPIEQPQKTAPEIKTREQIVSKITSELQNQKLPEIKKPKQQEQKQEKPKRSAGLIILFIILVILLGITLFIFFAKDTFFGLFGQVVKRLG